MKDVRVNSRLVIASAELGESFARSAGPGGQNVNKVATKVVLRWHPEASDSLQSLSEADRSYLLRRLSSKLTEDGALVISCDEHRTQRQNREEAREKLAQTLRTALHRPKTRRPTKPTKASVRRRLDAKKKRGDVKRGRRKLDD